MATAREDLAAANWRLRPMAQADLPRVAALERESYVFPWNDQIFADCLRVGYCCRVLCEGETIVAGSYQAIRELKDGAKVKPAKDSTKTEVTAS